MTLQRDSQAALSYDAVKILGFGPGSPEALPEAKPGETVLRYGGWSLKELRDSDVGRKLLHSQDWCDGYAWASEQLPSGIYVLRIPIPESNRKTFDEQSALLLPGEEPAHIVLAASALLAIQVSGGGDPLNGGWTRCKERTDDGRRVVLYWYNRRLDVSYNWVDNRRNYVWLSAARKIA